MVDYIAGCENAGEEKLEKATMENVTATCKTWKMTKKVARVQDAGQEINNEIAGMENWPTNNGATENA